MVYALEGCLDCDGAGLTSAITVDVEQMTSPWGETVTAWRIDVIGEGGNGFPMTNGRRLVEDAATDTFFVDACGTALAMGSPWSWDPGTWYDAPWKVVYPPVLGAAPVLPTKLDDVTAPRNMTWTLSGGATVPQTLVLRDAYSIQVTYRLQSFTNGQGQAAADRACVRQWDAPASTQALLEDYDVPVQPSLQEAVAAFLASPQAQNRDTWMADHPQATLVAVRFDPTVDTAYSPPVLFEGDPHGAWTLQYADSVQSLLVTCYWEPALADVDPIQCQDEVLPRAPTYSETKTRAFAPFPEAVSVAQRVRDVSECAVNVIAWSEPAQVSWCNELSLAGEPTHADAPFVQRLDTGRLAWMAPRF